MRHCEGPLISFASPKVAKPPGSKFMALVDYGEFYHYYVECKDELVHGINVICWD